MLKCKKNCFKENLDLNHEDGVMQNLNIKLCLKKIL